jgi:hypothetical protein
MASKDRARAVRAAAVQAAARADEDLPIAPVLRAEFERLGLLARYEARTALKLARQLDSGVIVGAAFTSQSKELDRRVEDLRRLAPQPDDATQRARGEVQERRLRLASG